MQFYFQTQPRSYQTEQFERSRSMPYYASFMDMRLGKTKLMIDTIGWLYCQEKIDAVFILSKANVCRNWELAELPKHLMSEIWDGSRCLVYQTRYAKTHNQKDKIGELRAHTGLSILIMSFDSFVTDAGKLAAWRLLKSRRVFYIVDESARIKTPSTARTRAVVKSGKFAPYRRIMTGTPFTNKGPFDGYSQMKFLYDKFWIEHGILNFGMFKTFFGEWEDKYNYKQSRPYKQLTAYKNLSLLKTWIQPFIHRLMKEDVSDTYQGKDYTKLYFELNSEQWKMYKELRKELFVELDGGAMLTAALAIVQLLRFQQITCGYLPNPDNPEGAGLSLLGKTNPRLECLLEFTEDMPYQGIIWARFTQDVNMILDALGNTAQRYDGLVKEIHRPQILEDFRNDKFQWLVAKASCLGEGSTLANANVAVYYSNTFSLTDRIQSEDRPILLDKPKKVLVVDLISDAPVCKHIINTLRSHQNIAETITGDTMKKWV